MKYIEIQLTIHPKNECINDLLAASLGEIGFESFMESEAGMNAYIPETLYEETKLRENLPAELFGSTIRMNMETIPDQNWNEVWETNHFTPIVLGKDCVIHSPSQLDVPLTPHDILIHPKMAFGTGHHETTVLMLGEILKLDLQNKSVLDMGCGTAVLAILTAQKGANPVLGIDIDEWAVNNSLENISLNHLESIEIRLGDASILTESSNFDFIFANIHRNILLNDMDKYVACMHPGSELFMSGFYETDLDTLTEKAVKLGLTYVGHTTKNTWVAARYKK